MTWNYRVVRGTNDFGEPEYTIREAYYDTMVSAIPSHITENPADPYGGSVEDLRACLKRMLAALDKNVLELKDGKVGECEEVDQ